MNDSFHVTDEIHQRSFDITLMRRLLEYVRPYRRWMLAAVCLLLLAAMLSNVTPLLIMWAVDNHISNPERTALQAAGAQGDSGTRLDELIQGDLRGLVLVLALIGGLVLVEALVRYAQMLIVAFIGQRTMLEMRVGLFEHLQAMSLRFVDQNPLGRLLTRVTNDVEKIQETVVSGVVQVTSDLMTLVVVLVFMLAVNWRLTLVAMIPVPFVVLTSAVFRKYAQRSFLEIRKKIARVNAYMQENVTGMRIVQLFRCEDRNYREYQARNAEHRDEWLRQIRNFAFYFPSVEFLGTLSTALIVLYSGVYIMQLGHMQTGVASVGTMFAFVFLADRFYGPIRALADRYNLLLEAMASSERVFQLLDTPPEILDRPAAVACRELEGQIDLKEVWFSYGETQVDSAWVLRGINLSVKPGERVAIVGHTGAGKTTIVNLLSRFYDVQRGAILIDGLDVRDYQQVTLRRHIGMVLQEVFLFSGTIAENIRLGDDSMDMDWVRSCAEYVNAARFIERMPGGYEYHVGERGCNLSTGQRQLLAFARALAHRPKILVLDEATASIDTETEALIQDAIAKLMAGRTSIVIAHRLSTVQHADRIVVMHHGEIRESGTHQQLLAQGGLYRTLYELQYKDQAIP
jgi:ATP-binding cassette subfamily B protein